MTTENESIQPPFTADALRERCEAIGRTMDGKTCRGCGEPQLAMDERGHCMLCKKRLARRRKALARWQRIRILKGLDKIEEDSE